MSGYYRDVKMMDLGILTHLFRPIADAIDNLHTSEEEKLQIRAAMSRVEIQAREKWLEYETALAESRRDVLVAEITGRSMLQRNWRPVTMLIFVTLVVVDVLGLGEHRLPADAWTVIQLGLGGYVVGRSAEKIAPLFSKRGAP